jgi:mitotic spindle assembly checkpoint protein MAD1
LVLEEAAKDIDAKERKQQSEVSRLQSQLLKAEKTETRLEDEIERLKAMLASYETEEKNHQSSTYDAAHGQRIALLETEVERLRGEAMTAQQQVENISARLAEAQMSQREAGDGEDASSLRARAEALQREKTTLESKVVGLEADVSRFDKEREEIWRENEMLWGRVGRGEFNQEKQRCLVLAQNPVSQELDVRKKTLDALKAENRGLLQRVEELSSVVSSSARGGGDSQTLVPQAVVQNLRNDIEALGVSIAAKDKAMLRLKQVFSAKANEFREAIQSLFGYKVKFLENGKVKLTSTFNRGKNSTSLIFESEDGNVGKMNLMGEAIQFPGLVNLAGLKEYWLDPNGIRQSVPCFLAALNLELYESCTMAVRRSGVNVDDDQDE